MSPLTLGLTGGVASGKSLVESQLRDLGAPVLDADQVARDVVAPGEPALAAIAETFGADMLLPEGTLDRRRMRERVFADADARKQLEDLLHPRIGERMQAWRAAQTAPYCVLSIAILLESRFRSLVDRVVVVDVDEAEQVRRLLSRDGISETLARQMLAAQTDRETRLRAADDVIDNSGTPEQTRAQVEMLHLRWCDAGAARRKAV